MKLSLSWLSDYVDLDGIALDDLVHRLTMSTCEVEEHFQTLPFLGQLLVAEVRTCEKHPDSDHLSKCTVFDGTTELSVICGAANVRAGIHVALAPVGAILPLKEGGELRLERRKIRGVLSEGMLCSARELQIDGILGDNGGILILEELPGEVFSFARESATHRSEGNGRARRTSSKATAAEGSPEREFLKAGRPLTDLFPYNDTVIDIDNKSITHRPDLWCHFGFAREIAAVFRKKLKHDPLAAAADATAQRPVEAKVAKKTISIESDAGGPAALAYHGMHCEGVRIAPAPLWMRLRLQAIGQKCINNVVDASNFVMYELGQPNHCFDADNLKQDRIICSAAKKALSFVALDGITYDVPAGAVLIHDGSDGTPVALGGVIGGQHSAISDATHRVFIESATFPRDRIRRALSAGAPRTESARRFEKGQDPSKAVPAVHRIVELLAETSPDLRCGKLTEAWAIDRKPRQNRIRLSLDFLRRRLGFDLKQKELEDILHRLHFEVKEEKKDLTITVPSFRSWHDVSIPEDIVEEVGRIYGYDNITPTPAPVAVEEPVPNLRRRFERSLKELMVQQAGFDETMNYSFAAVEENLPFGAEGIALKNPVQAERDRLRLSQIPGLLAQAATNQDRFEKVSLFELGRVFLPAKAGLPDEIVRLSLAHLAPSFEADQDRHGESTLSVFLAVRAAVEGVLNALGIPFVLRAPESPLFFLHPGCQVEFLSGKHLLGTMGLAHPSFARAQGIRNRIAVLGDFHFDALFALWNGERHTNHYRPPSVHPWSDFELTLLLDVGTSTAGPAQTLTDLGIAELRSLEIVSVYQGDPIPEGKMAVSYRMTAGANDGGIKHERLQEMITQSIRALEKAGYPLRG